MDTLAIIRNWKEHPPATLGWDGDIATLRRSAVAVVLRIPHHSAQSLDEYIATASQKQAAVEVLFIKRAISPRDRWSGHVALPGGRQNPGESDWETATRETLEEVGIDLVNDGWRLGPLDQRLLRISWFRKVAMCLCPFVFVLNKWDAPVKLQEDEVATAFWIPLSELMASRNSSSEYVPVGDRINYYWWVPQLLRKAIASQIGYLKFPAILLQPTTLLGGHGEIPVPPYRLWGVTLMILQDIFQLLDKTSVYRMSQPTFSHPDMRLILYILNYSHKKCRHQDVMEMLGTLLEIAPGKMDLANRMLQGHFANFPLAVFVTVTLRSVIIIILLRYGMNKLKRILKSHSFNR